MNKLIDKQGKDGKELFESYREDNPLGSAYEVEAKDPTKLASLAKKIQEKLIKMFPQKEFDFEFILASSEDVSRLRKDYAKQNPILEKPKDSKQSPSSHTIDAVVALSSVFKKVTNLDDVPTSNKILEFVQINNIPIKPLGKIEKEQIGNFLVHKT